MVLMAGPRFTSSPVLNPAALGTGSGSAKPGRLGTGCSKLPFEDVDEGSDTKSHPDKKEAAVPRPNGSDALLPAAEGFCPCS